MAPFKSRNPTAERRNPHTVILRGMDELEFDNLPAAAQVIPGMLIERTNGEVQPHSTDGGPAAPTFAVERRENGMLADDYTFPTENRVPGINHALYYVGDTVRFAGFDKLHWVWGLVADGNSVEEDKPVVSSGDGMVRGLDTANGETAENSVVSALESVDNTGDSDGPDRVRLEVTT